MENLNDFVLNDSQAYRKARLAVTYTIIDKEEGQKVAAFFCLSNDKISISDFDTKTKYNHFSKRFANAKRLKSYPAAKIGRFAVSLSMKGQYIGSAILDFIKSFLLSTTKLAVVFSLLTHTTMLSRST